MRLKKRSPLNRKGDGVFCVLVLRFVGQVRSPISSSLPATTTAELRKLVCLANEFLPFDLRLGWQVQSGGGRDWLGEEGEARREKGSRGGSLRESVAKASSSVPSSESTSRLFEPRSEWRRHFKAIPALSSGNSSPPSPKLQFPPPASPTSLAPHLVLLALNFDLISSIALEGLEFGMVPGEGGGMGGTSWDDRRSDGEPGPLFLQFQLEVEGGRRRLVVGVVV